ncbi:MAG: cytochrome 450-like protein [Satyrvirus sp.]|uniref:Cytochrome 450-like protein n=1 Tax=Satyrvirus sp. TaxID=2487771 RepID=A0A3G5AGL7_9VIRU|nr:MAG: cytochrome 450-like protein [Satyrvirus sp.]
MSEKIIWSIKDVDTIKLSPIHSWPIALLKFVDDLIPRYGILKDIPTIGGDLYEFSSKGLLKFIIDKIQNRYDEKIINIRIVHMPMVLILDAELSKEILLCKKVRRGRIYDRLTDFFGFGIFTSNIHDKWFHQRKTVFRLFQRKNLEFITPTLAESMFSVLDKELGKEVDFQLLLSKMGLIGFCQTIFGVDISDIYMDLMEPLNRLLVYMNSAIEPFVIAWDPSYVEFSKDKDIVHAWVRELIARAKNSNKCNPIILEEFGREDITEIELIEFVLSVVFGGHETTSKLILATIYSLCNNRQFIDKLNLETEEYFATHTNYEIDVMKMPYLKNIINEGTRLYPSAWILSRETSEQIEFGDFNFKGGTQFLISPLIFLRSEKIWGNDAEIFNPERFEQLTDQAQKTFIPFVVGMENCPGKMFAELEACIVISKLFYSYKIELLDHEIVPNSAITFRLFNKLPVVITKKIQI